MGEEKDHVKHWVNAKIGYNSNGPKFHHINKYLYNDFRKLVDNAGMNKIAFELRAFFSSKLNALFYLFLKIPGVNELLARRIIIILQK